MAQYLDRSVVRAREKRMGPRVRDDEFGDR